ncbi:MAG: hypothetical protein V1911_01930 [Candidatus Micrarchaeota archaeon]
MSETMTVRVPEQLRTEAEILVKEGYFRSLSDVIVSGLRREIVETGPAKATLALRESNRKMWDEYRKKAKGDEEKAWSLYFNDLKKIEKKYTKIFKVLKPGQE